MPHEIARGKRQTPFKRGLRGVLAAGVFVGLLVSAKPFVRINTTPSMPMGLYGVQPTPGALERGQTVVMCLPQDVAKHAMARGYIGHGECPGDYESLLKPVSAVSGDTVRLSGEGARVNGVLIPNTKPKDHDSLGRPIQHYPLGTYVVDPATFWSFANFDPRSFDSRYFGPISVFDVIGTANPIITAGE